MKPIRFDGVRASTGIGLWLSLWLICLAGVRLEGRAADVILPGEATIRLLAPKSGTEVASPGPVVIEAEAVDPLGDIRHLDFYANDRWIGASDYLLKIGVIPGRPIPHRLEWKDIAPGAYRVTARGQDTRGRQVVSAPVAVEVTAAAEPGLVLVPKGAGWRWLYDGVDPGERWRAVGFDASGWKEGKAELGFGEGDEQSVIWIGRSPYPVTAYFRTEFQVPADLEFSRLLISLRRDDGAAVYLNGRELLRDNLPSGPIEASTPALVATEGDEVREFSVPSTALVTGRNVLAVEVHQHSITSEDLSFDLQLSGVAKVTPAVAVVSIEATAPNTSEPSPLIRVAPGRFTVRREGGAALPLSVFLEYAGTAEPRLDYAALPRVVEIPAGKMEVELEVVAVDDELDEKNETVVATIVPSPMSSALAGYRIDEKRSRAEVLIYDTDPAPEVEAGLKITQPVDGAWYRAGEAIEVRAVAVDPKGYVSRVEFYDSDRLIGVSEITFIRAPDPGTPIEHTLAWEGAAEGEHKLMAKAVSSTGAAVRSAPVLVRVGEGAWLPVVVEVAAAVAEATEPANGVAGKGATFVVKRSSGAQDVALAVFYRMTGTASNGVDYARLTGEVLLPKGRDAVEIALRPLADSLREGDETVVFELLTPVCPAIFPPPAGCYQVGGNGQARVVIHDSLSANQAPRVGLTSPRNGAVYTTAEVIPVRAVASDADGKVVRLDVLVDGRPLGSTSLDTLEVEWKNPAAGTHELVARAVDDRGMETVSAMVKVHVRDIASLAFVRRELPPAYLPGGVLEVTLEAVPPRGSHAWTVEETPPSGWLVEVEGEDRFHDRTTGVIRFGPFTDASVRRLTYRATAPATASGVQEFSGTSSLDGRTLPVTGSSSVALAGEYHPADVAAADGKLVANEITAYAAAWKAGRAWGTNEASIPASYVTRGGAIWRRGGGYSFVPAAGAPPECWVPAGGASPGLAAPGGVPATGETTAVRSVPSEWRPGTAGRVVVRLRPSAGASASAVEEILPSGWTVVRVSDDGVYDAVAGRVRWGLFEGSQPRELEYDLVPPREVASNGRLEGSVSVDGRMFPTIGQGSVGAAGGEASLRVVGLERAERGRLRFRVEAPENQVFAVEASSDLKGWVPVEAFIYTGEVLELDDALAETESGRYYRLRPLGP